MNRPLRTLHRWLALSLGLFVVGLGLTGSVIAWRHELDTVLNPELLQVAVDDKHAMHSPAAMLARLNALPEYAHPYMLELPQKKNDVFIAWYKTPTQVARQVMLNPFTGVIIGERNWGEVGFSRPLLMPTLFHLHRQLLAGETGKIVVALLGIALAILALSGIYLWWPAWRTKAWWHAITLSRSGSWKHINFRLHRTLGFYVAPVLLILAVTGIYFNKPHWVMPVVKKPTVQMQGELLPLAEVLRIAQDQFPRAHITRINFPKEPSSLYEIRLHQSGELRERTGATRVMIDGVEGRVIAIQDPLTAEKWEGIASYFFPLHSGEIFGVVSKVAISLIGLLPLLFAISGTLIWWARKKP